MIAVDTNVLVHAHRKDSVWHDAAKSCVRGLAEGTEPWAIPWPCVHEFLAIVTHPRIYTPPTSIENAIVQVEAWSESPGLVFLAETSEHLIHIRDAMVAGRVAGARVHDARVAVICLEHGISELWTADRDFGRFPQLKIRNPLIG